MFEPKLLPVDLDPHRFTLASGPSWLLTHPDVNFGFGGLMPWLLSSCEKLGRSDILIGAGDIDDVESNFVLVDPLTTYERNLDLIVHRLTERERVPAVYFAHTEDQRFLNLLARYGFQPSYTDRWMVRRDLEWGRDLCPPDLRIEDVTSRLAGCRDEQRTTMQEFLASYNGAWNEADEESAYNLDSSLYERSWFNLLTDLAPHPPFSLLHSYVDNECVGHGVVLYSGKTAMIYTISTVRERQRNGYGTAMVAACVAVARERGCEEVTAFTHSSFPDLDAPTHTEAWWTGLGWQTSMFGRVFVKEERV